MPFVCSVGDSYDNALAGTINGLYKAKVIWRQRSWPSLSAVEMVTLHWVDWFNNHRLFRPIGHIPPAKAAEAATILIANVEGALILARVTRDKRPLELIPAALAPLLIPPPGPSAKGARNS